MTLNRKRENGALAPLLSLKWTKWHGCLVLPWKQLRRVWSRADTQEHSLITLLPCACLLCSVMWSPPLDHTATSICLKTLDWSITWRVQWIRVGLSLKQQLTFDAVTSSLQSTGWINTVTVQQQGGHRWKVETTAVEAECWFSFSLSLGKNARLTWRRLRGWLQPTKKKKKKKGKSN